jgi:hypothetical protein
MEYPTPIPIIAPMRVCDEDAGIPLYHVNKFQLIAEIRSAETICIVWYVFPSVRISVGINPTIAIVTPTPPVIKPKKFINPLQITAVVGFRDFV